MPNPVYLVSVPGLREQDLLQMPHLAKLAKGGSQTTLTPSFPAVTCPVQANLTTGHLPAEHGVVANGFYWRDRSDLPYDGVEMWTAWDQVIQKPRVWDLLHAHDPGIKTAVWFPLLAKGCGADLVCTPAPIHNPDGSESLWCYTKPEGMYGELRDALGHFPLKHFWGPLAGIEGSRWIVGSLLWAVEREQPDFTYVYLPHLDYAAQKHGPDSVEARTACAALDEELRRLIDGVVAANDREPIWLIASEYTILPVDHVTYPNRVLREASLLKVRNDEEGKERIDFAASDAWALVDHQHAHIFVRDRSPQLVARVAECFADAEGIAQVLEGDALVQAGLSHGRSGDLVLVSEANSWQAYYWWLDASAAPAFARRVDIHRKPGYDPVEMFFDPQLMQQHGGGIPLDATLVRGSHGAPGAEPGVLLSNDQGLLDRMTLRDTDLTPLVLRHFGAAWNAST